MKKLLLALTSTFFFSTITLAQTGNIEVKSEVFKVVETTDTKGNKSIKHIKADETSIAPNDTVIYINTITNIGKENAGNIIVTNPISRELSYVEGSAEGKATKINFSIDRGQSFHQPEDLKVEDLHGNEKRALAKDYNAIQWIYLPKLKPGEVSTMSFKAILGQ